MDPSSISKTRALLPQKRKRSDEITRRNVLYFDTLPDFATEHIVRLLAPKSKQKEANWSDYVPAGTVLALLKSAGSLRRLTKNFFRSVHFSISGNGLPDKSGLQVCGKHKRIAHFMNALPVELGEGIETLNICAPLAPAFTRAVAKHCTSLRNLSFQPVSSSIPNIGFSTILTERGPALEFLGLSFFKGNECMVNALTHCRSLRHLKIWYPKGDFSFAPLWKSLGSSLEHLEIKAVGQLKVFALKQLYPNCSNISRLAFNVADEEVEEDRDDEDDEEDDNLEGHLRDEETNWNMAIEDVCKRYGASLVGLQLRSSNIGAAKLARICRACPNLDIDFEEDAKGCHRCTPPGSRSTEIALALGPAAIAWTLLDYGVDQSDEIACVGISCPNLVKVAMDLNDSFLKVSFAKLFTFPRPMLKEMDISTGSVSCITSVLQVLANKVSLHSFLYKGQVLPLEPFRQFVLAQTELKEIEFRCTGWCSCHSYRNDPAHLLEEHAEDMGFSWGAIVTACMENPSVEMILGRCLFWEESELEAEDYAPSMPSVWGTNVTVIICGSMIF